MTSSDTAHTITAKNPTDLIASVPVLLGFTPTESVVMLTFGPHRSFHARIDLPRSVADREVVIEALLEPVLRYEVETVAFVLYSTATVGVRSLARALCEAFEAQDVSVLDALHATGTEWFPMLPGITPADVGVPYDDRTSPIALKALVEGHVTYESRSALAATLRADVASVSAVASHLRPTGVRDGRQALEDAVWALSLVRTHAQDNTQPDDADVARLLVALVNLKVRDAVWCALTLETARDLVQFWSGIVRRSPLSVLAAPATLLAFAAWLSGHGALAWCALDRSRESDKDYSLAHLLAHMLNRAIPPSAWSPPTDLIAELGLDS